VSAPYPVAVGVAIAVAAAVAAASVVKESASEVEPELDLVLQVDLHPMEGSDSPLHHFRSCEAIQSPSAIETCASDARLPCACRAA
jgi:hypothetical protein